MVSQSSKTRAKCHRSVRERVLHDQRSTLREVDLRTLVRSAPIAAFDEIGGDGDRVRSKRHVTIRLAPTGEVSSRGRVGLARSFGVGGLHGGRDPLCDGRRDLRLHSYWPAGAGNAYRSGNCGCSAWSDVHTSGVAQLTDTLALQNSAELAPTVPKCNLRGRLPRMLCQGVALGRLGRQAIETCFSTTVSMTSLRVSRLSARPDSSAWPTCDSLVTPSHAQRRPFNTKAALNCTNAKITITENGHPARI